MKINEIEKNINCLEIPEKGYIFVPCNSLFYGVKYTGEYVIAARINANKVSCIQNTKYLTLQTNIKVLVKIDSGFEEENMSIITLNKNALEYKDIFLSLFCSFLDSSDNNNLELLFNDLIELFSKKINYSNSELQGLYGELYFIYLYKSKYNIDISNFYQNEQYRKFDFSFSENSKIDVKTTLSNIRTHHFLLEQLNSLRYEIYIVSILLIKDDAGFSLLDLIKFCFINFQSNYKLNKILQNIVLKINSDVLSNFKYNERYLLDNIRIYCANNIPKIREKTQDGVFNVRFESDLTNVLDYFKYDDFVNVINKSLIN